MMGADDDIDTREGRMRKPLIIGQAPARGNDALPPFSGKSGARLALLAGVGDSGDVLPNHFELRNLFDKYPGKQGKKGDKFDMRAGRKRAPKLLEEYEGTDQVILLMGKRVAKAFGVHSYEYLAWFVLDGHHCMIFPHPSGINLWWNDPKNVAAASGVLESIVDFHG